MPTRASARIDRSTSDRRRRRHRILSTTVTASVAAITLVGLAPGVAHAAVTETTVTLPVTAAYDVATTDGSVFVSGGPSSTTIAVTGAAGDNVRTIDDLAGPTDLQLSADHRTLFVALKNANEIAAFDTTTLQEKARYETGAGDCPASLALTGTNLWFGYGCEDRYGSHLGRIDLAANPPTVTTVVSPVYTHGNPLLNAGVNNPGLLFVSQPRLSPGSVSVLKVGPDGSLTLAGEVASSVLFSNLLEVGVAPDGASFYLASGAPYEILQFNTDQLGVARRRFPTGPYPNAVEVAPDGRQVAAANGASLFAFRPTSAAPTKLTLSGSDPIFDGAVAWAPSGSRLYAVTGVRWNSTTPVVLHIYTASIASIAA
jgi:hypothetical protein